MDMKLGHVYTDKIHGLVGVAVAQVRYLTGCDRVHLEVNKEGEIKDYWFDVTMVTEVAEHDVGYRDPVIPIDLQPKVEMSPEPVAVKPGGPRTPPPSRNP
jgi:hypothetical protein